MLARMACFGFVGVFYACWVYILCLIGACFVLTGGLFVLDGVLVSCLLCTCACA